MATYQNHFIEGKPIIANCFKSYLQAIFQGMGIRDGFLFLFSEFIRLISFEKIKFAKYYFFSQPIGDRNYLPANRGADIEIRSIDKKEAEYLVHECNESLTDGSEEYESYFANQSNCLAAFKQNKMIGRIWLKKGPQLWNYDDFFCYRLVPSPIELTACDFDLYIKPEYRGGVLYAKIWDKACQFLKSSGVQWSVSEISAFNTLSLASQLRLGAYPIASVCFIRCGGFQITVTGSAPHFHFSYKGKFIPNIYVSADLKKSYARFKQRK